MLPAEHKVEREECSINVVTVPALKRGQSNILGISIDPIFLTPFLRRMSTNIYLSRGA